MKIEKEKNVKHLRHDWSQVRLSDHHDYEEGHQDTAPPSDPPSTCCSKVMLSPFSMMRPTGLRVPFFIWTLNQGRFSFPFSIVCINGQKIADFSAIINLKSDVTASNHLFGAVHDEIHVFIEAYDVAFNARVNILVQPNHDTWSILKIAKNQIDGLKLKKKMTVKLMGLKFIGTWLKRIRTNGIWIERTNLPAPSPSGPFLLCTPLWLLMEWF